MSRLANVSILVRTILAFGLVLLVTMGLGAFFLKEVSLIEQAASGLGGHAMPSLSQAGEMLNSVVNSRREEANRLLSVTADDAGYRESLIQGYVEKARKARALYQPLSEPEQSTLAEFDGLLPHYVTTTNQVLALIDKGDADGAHRLYVGDNRKYFDAANLLLARLVELNNKSGEASYRTLSEAVSWSRDGTLLALALASCVAFAMGYLTVRTTASPVGRLTSTMLQLSKHDLEVTIPDTSRRDEIGAMACAVEVFKSGLIEADRLTVAQGVEEAAKSKRVDAINGLVSAFDSQSTVALTTFGTAASQLDTTARSMAGLAKESISQTQEAAATVDRITNSFHSVEDAAEKMSSSISGINEQVTHAKRIADRAANDIRNTQDTVNVLTKAAQKIGEIVTLINAVAAQTNLLALNATIEAARAGEFGRGFAVVAAEVKGLASQTAKATEEITTHIAAVQKVSGETAGAIEGIGTTIEELNNISAHISEAMSDQGQSTYNIRDHVRQASSDTRTMVQTMRYVADAATQSGAAAGQVLHAASELAARSTSLQSQVAVFLKDVKTA